MLAVLAMCDARADDSALGRQLTEEMAYGQAFEDSQGVCRENVAAYDVEQSVSDTPNLLGGIKPGDPEWPEAKALYIKMAEAGCLFDGSAAEDALASTLADALSTSDLEALIAFYRSDLGGRFRQASLAASTAANRAAKPLTDPDAVYADFGEKIAALLARRDAPVEVLALRAASPADSADTAVLLSDRIMQHVTDGEVREGLQLAKRHSIVPEADLDALIEHAEAQRPIMEARFGESLDYELLRNDSVGGSMIRVVFLHRFENHAVPWQFVWYRGGDGWLLSSFKFTDDVAALFQ